MLRVVIAACILCVCAGCSEAGAKRVALVIGNSAYRSISPLANPGNDARLVADSLAAAGFDVQLAADLTRAGMQAALGQFALDAMQADVAMVYYAGHGMEASGSNWLLPVDADIRSFDDMPAAAIPFEAVARSLAGASVKIIALDACRDNPFAARLPSPAGVINRGLAEVELDGYVIMYAAAAGQVASDGDRNSPFARAYARWVGEQNVDLRLLGGKIRDDVIASTGGAQRPFVSASLPGEVTALAPASDGRVREARSHEERMPYYFDYVRTLRDKGCIPTRDIKCQTELMVEAGGHLVTLDDDARLRVWDAAGDAPVRVEPVPDSRVWPVEVRFEAAAHRLIVSHHGEIITVPLKGGAAERKTLEHNFSPQFVQAAGSPPIAVYAYPDRCTFGFVDVGGFSFAGATQWSPACMRATLHWSLPDPASDRFAARVTTANMTKPYKVEELLLASARSREVLCRVEGGGNDAAFDAEGDLYTARDDGSILRHGPDCRVKETYPQHRGAVEQVMALSGGRVLSRSVDGVMKIWSPGGAQAEKELTGLPREARIVDASEDGSAVLILNEDQRLYVWYGEPRLGPYIGPSERVCGGALSADRNMVHALRCDGNVELWRRQRTSH